MKRDCTTTVIGRRNPQAEEVCQFLSRNKVPHRWIDLDDDPLGDMLAGTVARDRLPLVLFDDGTHLEAPPDNQPMDRWMAELSHRMGLNTQPKLATYDTVIVGAGPAGLTAAVYAASEGLSTLVIERMAPGGQAGTSSLIENYPGFPEGVSGAQLAAGALQQATRLGAEVLVGVDVEHFSHHDLVLSSGMTVAASTVILATGVSYRTLDVPGVDELLGRGVFYGSAPHEAPDYRGKRVGIVGGANSAGQAALHFAEYASAVLMFVRKPELDAGMSAYLIERIENHPRIEVYTETEVVRVVGNGKLRQVSLTGKVGAQARKLDGLYLMIGGQPRTGGVAGWVNTDDQGFILTGKDISATALHGAPTPAMLETTVHGVFAAGDARHGSIKRVASAVGEGAMAVSLVHDYLQRQEQK